MVNGDDSCFDVCMYGCRVVMETMFKQGSSCCSHRYTGHVVNRMGSACYAIQWNSLRHSQ